jgi:hypothetical protein
MTTTTAEALLLEGIRLAFATSEGNPQTPEAIVAFLRPAYLPAIIAAARAEATADTLDMDHWREEAQRLRSGLVEVLRLSPDCDGAQYARRVLSSASTFVSPTEGTLRSLLAEMVGDYHHTGSIRDHVDPGAKGWEVNKDWRVCDDALCVATAAALTPAQPAPAGGTERCGWPDPEKDFAPCGYLRATIWHMHEGSCRYRNGDHEPYSACHPFTPATPRAGSDVEGWLAMLTEGSPWAEDMTCIGCGKRQYRVERDGGAHRSDCAWVAARAYLAALPAPVAPDRP